MAGDEFARLLAIWPNEPMILFQRGQGREEAGDLYGALDDYVLARRRFPRRSWKDCAEEAMERVAEMIAELEEG